MKIHKFVSLLMIGVFLFTACENTKVENAVSNENKIANNQIIVNNVVNNSNISDGTNSTNETANIGINANEKSDFAGTAGITDKKYQIKSAAILNKVRTAQHDSYDRVVFEFAGAEMPSYHIEYIDKPVRACGSGNVVPLIGDGWLEIRFQPANAHTEDGKPTVENRELFPNHKIVKELKLTCDFEADVTWVLGVSSPNKYRVLELENPTRLAIDIRH